MTDSSEDAYLCHDCLAVFLFKDDVEDHNRATGHKSAAAVRIISAVKLGDKDFLLFEVPSSGQ